MQQSRVGLIIDEISIKSDQLRDGQAYALECMTQQLSEVLRHLKDGVGNCSNTRKLLLATLQTTREAPGLMQHEPRSGCLVDKESHRSVVKFRAYASEFRLSRCTANCRCACHRAHTLGWPTIFRKITGVLFVGYSGTPSLGRWKCSVQDCISRPASREYVYYTSPLWFLAKAIILTLESGFAGTVTMSLTVTRVVSSGSDIFRFARLNDVDGLKYLFSKGLASPKDIDQDGYDVLSVSCQKCDLY